MTTLPLFASTASLWRHVPVEYPPARELADRHYPRETHGAKGILRPGWRFLLWHEDARGAAVWGVVRGRFRQRWTWRNTIFRNESAAMSSDLIREATTETYALWARRYKALPTERLMTEVDIAATAKRRSKRKPAGHCYAMAGWDFIGEIDPGHGRPARAIWAAPIPYYPDGAVCDLEVAARAADDEQLVLTWGSRDPS